MFWLPAPGGGWVLQPTAPALQGCVITAGTPRGFGFKNTIHAITAPVAALALLWLCMYGHMIEAVGAVLAAVLIETVSKPVKQTGQALRRIISPTPSGGE